MLTIVSTVVARNSIDEILHRPSLQNKWMRFRNVEQAQQEHMQTLNALVKTPPPPPPPLRLKLVPLVAMLSQPYLSANHYTAEPLLTKADTLGTFQSVSLVKVYKICATSVDDSTVSLIKFQVVNQAIMNSSS